MHSHFLKFADQDAINIICFNSILHIDEKWNSSDATTISNDPYINHVIHVKPWNPYSKWWPLWAATYASSGAMQSISQH